jgi:hypothetical protein
MYTFFQKNKISILLSVLVFAVMFSASPSVAHAASFSISPTDGGFEVGEIIPIKILVNSGGESFNAVSGMVQFSSSVFAIESVSKANSVLNFWVTEPSISKSSGTVRFEGVALGGSRVSTGTIVTINVKAIKSGDGQISFTSGQILANDGQGTDITDRLSSYNISVSAPAVKTTTTKKVPDVAPKKEVPVEEVAPEVEDTSAQSIIILKAPNIFSGDKYGVQAISGTSDYPRSKVLVTFLSEDGVKIFIVTDSDADGNFYSLVPRSLKHGYYTVTVVMIREDNASSATSNMLVVKVGNTISDLGWNVVTLIGLLIASIIYLTLRIYFHLERNVSGQNTKSLHKTEDLIRKSFDLIREDIDELDTKRMSVDERKQIRFIEKDLEDGEKVIVKEIKDLE